tara:strand:+ start:52 stop:396 length:345 start_codon:yes stop_codon:yes gene_type:complete
MNRLQQHKGWKWKTDPAHRKAFLDALANQIKINYEGKLSKVPRSFVYRFAEWFAPISYYGFGYGDGVKSGGIRQQTEWVFDKQSISKLAKTHLCGLITRTEYRIELQHRGIRLD